jgi:hypothetical protein
LASTSSFVFPTARMPPDVVDVTKLDPSALTLATSRTPP